MDNSNKICMYCMRTIESDTLICPHCSHNTLETNEAQYIKEKTVLAGRYCIGHTTKIESDCVTYAALDIQTKKAIEIVEFFPKKLVSRDALSGNVVANAGQDTFYSVYLQEFVRLWKTLESLKGNIALPNVIEVLIYNSTAYAVLEKIRTVSLESYLTDKTKLLSWSNCVSAFGDIILAIERLHSCGMLHCAISPSTVLVGSDGKLHLGGFSIQRTKSETSLLYSVPNADFAAIELFDRRFTLGTYTDVYSVAAVMYFCLTGIEPQSSIERYDDDRMMIPFEIANMLDPSSIDALYSALRVSPKDRTQTVIEFRDSILPSFASENQLAVVPEKSQEHIESDTDEYAFESEPKEKTQSKAVLSIKIILTGLLIASMLFCTLYATVLYKSIHIDFLSDAFSAFSFLPINSDDSTTTTLAEMPTSTTSAEPVTVADFISLTYSDILNNKTFNKNFSIIYEFEPSDSVPKNSIISQSIEKGSKVKMGTEITIVVSTGKAITVLKDVIGMQYEDAYEILTADGFVVEKNLLDNNGAQTPGKVFTMSLVAGLDFEKGTTVVLSVWDEVKETEPVSVSEGTDSSADSSVQDADR